jgi:hypothetical protein
MGHNDNAEVGEDDLIEALDNIETN